MSIILDALKKAETERHIGKIPGLHTPASADSGLSALRDHGRVRLVWAGVSAMALLLIGVALWWYANVDDVAVARTRLMAAPTSTLPVPASVSAIVVPSPIEVVVASRGDIPVPPPIVPSPAAVLVSRGMPTPTQVPKQMQTQTSVPVIVSKPPQAVGSTSTQQSVQPATPAEKIIAMSELSPSMQRELPPLAIGGSMYSDNAAERMLLIDKRLFHEGDEVAPGLLLEKLMPKEAILRFRGVRFRINF